MDSYYFGFFKPNAEKSEIMKSIFEKGLMSCIDEVKTWQGYENIFKKMNKLSVARRFSFHETK